MNVEKEISMPYKKSDLEFLKEQMDKAIAKEDYEQAAVIRNYLNPELSSEIGEKIDSDLKADAEFRAIKGVEEIRQKSYWQDKDIVDNSIFSKVLNNTFLNTKNSRETIKDNFISRGDKDGILKVDCLIELYNDRDELTKVMETIKDRFNHIWQPYREEAGLVQPEYNEYKTLYTDSVLNGDNLRNINNVPIPLRGPLEYWQNAYDNARLLLDIIEEVIDDLEKKPLK